jgi:hypothetical protein
MLRCLLWLPAIALAACGSADYQRPRTVEYVTMAILAPNCGNAQCHSQFRNVSGFAFDTVENAQHSLAGGLVGSIGLNQLNEPVGEPEGALLVNVLTRTLDRMPYDQPLPEAEIELIRDWIEFGAPGAQCNPTIEGERVCTSGKVVECLDSFDYGGVIDDCAAQGMDCAAGACR